VVLLEVQMRADPGFHHRLAAQTFRFLQLHPAVEHWRVVVITPHQRLNLGPVTPLSICSPCRCAPSRSWGSAAAGS
jgi:predicted transposase YdaD